MAAKPRRSDPHLASPTVLVVDAESYPRGEICRMVRGLGYRVRAARSGPDALRHLTEHPGEIRLILSDIGLPHMDGGELAERARDLQPGVRVVLMSSSLAGEVGELLAAYPETPFLARPFEFAELYAVLVWQAGPPAAAGEIRPTRPAFHREREAST